VGTEPVNDYAGCMHLHSDDGSLMQAEFKTDARLPTILVIRTAMLLWCATVDAADPEAVGMPSPAPVSRFWGYSWDAWLIIVPLLWKRVATLDNAPSFVRGPGAGRSGDRV